MTAVRVRPPVDGLVSYHFFRNDRDMVPVTHPGRLRLIGDSGAYSAHTQGAEISLGEYAEWCLRWRDRMFWFASLDVLGDPVTTFRNWRRLRDRGVESVPTLHSGVDVKWMDRYVGEGVDFLGLGGMVRVALRSFGWLVHTFRHARDHHPQVRFHGWGLTHRRLLDALPFYSADSSGVFDQSFRYGKIRLFNPATTRDVTVCLDGRDVYRHATLLRRTYGVHPDAIATSHAGNRTTLIRLTAASVQQFSSWLERRHQVSPPTWSVRPAGGELTCPTGTRVHLSGNGDDLRATSPEMDPDPDTGRLTVAS